MTEFFKSDIEFINTGVIGSPDIYIRRLHQRWEIKRIDGNSPDTVHHAFSRARYQSNNLIIVAGKTRLSSQQIMGRMRQELIQRPYIKGLIFLGKEEKALLIKGKV